MITEAGLNVYVKFEGDADGFSRCATADDRRVMNEETWHSIAVLLQEVAVLGSGLVDPIYKQIIDAKILAQAASPRVAERIRKLVSTPGDGQERH
jgi:hypothetical protein